MHIVKNELQNHSSERAILLQDCASVFHQQKLLLYKPFKSGRAFGEKLYSYFIQEDLVSKVKKVFAMVSFVDHSIALEKMTQSIKQRQAFLSAMEAQKESVVIYMKISEFEQMEKQYEKELLYLVEEEVYRYMQEKKFEVSPLFAKLYWLGNGEYAITFERSLLNGSLELLVPYIKKFQRMIRNRVLLVAKRRHYISMRVVVSDEMDAPLQNALSGMASLEVSGKDFLLLNKAGYVL